MTSIRRLIERKAFPQDNPARAVTTFGNYGYVIDPPPLKTITANVSEDSAIAISAVYRAVQLIASTIASLPLHVYEKQDDGSNQPVEYAEDAYLWQRPNEEVPDVVFWETVIGHEVLNGNAYLFVQKNDAGEAWQLWPIAPQRVRVRRDEKGVKAYIIDGETVMRDYLYGGDIVHVPGFGTDGLKGLSPVALFALTLGLTKAAEQYAGHLFASGSTPSGILTVDDDLTEPEAKTLQAAWEDAHGGVSNSHKVAVLSGGVKWQATSMNPEDAQMLATRQFQVAEIARMFGVPEHLIGAHDKQSSWGTGIEVNNRFFLQTGLLPHMRRFEATIRDELLFGKRTVRWEVEGLLRGTSTERAAFYKTMREIGVYTVNDILALENRASIGPEGDTRVTPLNMGQLGAGADSPPLPAPGDANR